MARLPVTATRRPDRVRQYDGPQEAIVRSVTAKGVMFSVLDRTGAASSEVLGPAGWQRPVLPHAAGDPGVLGTPPARTRCLIVFVGTGVDRPWVLAFSGWPS